MGLISVRCYVTIGSFSTEYIVQVKDGNDLKWEGPVSRKMVDITQAVKPEEAVSGRIKAYLINSDEKSGLVEMPNDSWVHGSRVRIPRALFETAK